MKNDTQIQQVKAQVNTIMSGMIKPSLRYSDKLSNGYRLKWWRCNYSDISTMKQLSPALSLIDGVAEVRINEDEPSFTVIIKF
jgi:hypothetical protein